MEVEEKLTPHQERMRVEEKELKDNIEKCYDFTQGKVFAELPDYQKQLLQIQLEAMRTYWRVLSYRVSNNF